MIPPEAWVCGVAAISALVLRRHEPDTGRRQCRMRVPAQFKNLMPVLLFGLEAPSYTAADMKRQTSSCMRHVVERKMPCPGAIVAAPCS